MDAITRAQRITREFNLFWRVNREGLGAPDFRSVEDYRGEMKAIAMHALNPALREAAKKAITRFDSVASTAAPPGVPRAANNA